MIKRKVNRQKLYTIIKDKIKKPNLITLDTKYQVPELNRLKLLLDRTAINEAKYVADYYDCENFAFHLMSVLALKYRINAFGTVISYDSEHGFNVAVALKDNDFKVYKVEPQSDKIWEAVGEKTERYDAKGEIILI